MFALKFKPFFNVKLSDKVFKRYRGKVQMKVCPSSLPTMNVTIAGATTHVGRTTAFLLKQSPLIKKIYLYDRDETEKMANHLGQINTSTEIYPATGIKKLKEVVLNSRIMLICGGHPTFPNDTEERLFYQNADFVRQVVMYCAEYNPRISIAIATPPISYMVSMAVEECKKADVFIENRIFGIVTPNICRANTLVAEYLDLNPEHVDCMIIGGAHRRDAVPVLSQLLAKNTRQRKFQERLWRNIVEAEEDIIYQKCNENCKRGAYLSNAHGITKFVIELAKALHGMPDIKECTFVKQEKPIKLISRYMTTPIAIDKTGVKRSSFPRLSELEEYRFQHTLQNIKLNSRLGEFYITGDDFILRKRRECKRLKVFEKMKKEIGVKQEEYDLVCRPLEKIDEQEHECRTQFKLVTSAEDRRRYK